MTWLSDCRAIAWFDFDFDFFGKEALSARKTIAELWDGRLRGDIGLVCAAGGRMVAS